MQTLVDHDAESERDTLRDVKVVTTNTCQPTVELDTSPEEKN